MNKVLVAGVESVVGANLAVCLARNHAMTGVCLEEPISFGGCELEPPVGRSAGAIEDLIDRVKPDRIVYCGASARTGWESDPPREEDVQLAATWIQAARAANSHVTLISSSSTFTGPWMFHSESSQSLCSSRPAQCIQSIESDATAKCPDSLIVRTHAFGWRPGGKSGWVESLLTKLEQGDTREMDCFRHASPILASDLADVISRAWMAGLSGVYHIAGAERSNPVQFARRLAHHFRLPCPTVIHNEALVDRPEGFGCGETSLQTRKIRRALHVSLPMLEDGVTRLFQQHADGYRSRLTGNSFMPGSRVA